MKVDLLAHEAWAILRAIDAMRDGDGMDKALGLNTAYDKVNEAYLAE